MNWKGILWYVVIFYFKCLIIKVIIVWSVFLYMICSYIGIKRKIKLGCCVIKKNLILCKFVWLNIIKCSW